MEAAARAWQEATMKTDINSSSIKIRECVEIAPNDTYRFVEKVFIDTASFNNKDHDKDFELAILELKSPYETKLSRPIGYIKERAKNDISLGIFFLFSNT